MPQFNAGIIIIGDEILSGKTKDTNANFIAKQLIKNGIQLNEIRVIPDETQTIVKYVREFSKKYNYVFTTGGIGPTHDDITSKSISKAFNRKYKINFKAYRILKNYYPKGEFNEGRKKMAKIPEGSELIFNPLTAAPGFNIKNVFVFPGVPLIMRKMFKNVIKNIKTSKPKKICTIKTNLYESIMAKNLSTINKKYKKCSIGSYPFFNFKKKIGGVNIVVSSWEVEDLSLIIKEISRMISLLGGKSSIVAL